MTHADDVTHLDSMAWQVIGFGRDEALCSATSVTAEQVVALRPLPDVGDDLWLCAASYPLAPAVWPTVRAVIPGIALRADALYFIEAYQLPSAGSPAS